MGKWIDLVFSQEENEIDHLKNELDHLKYELACARQRESDLRAANAYETEIWEKRYNELKSENSDLAFEVMTLKSSSSLTRYVRDRLGKFELIVTIASLGNHGLEIKLLMFNLHFVLLEPVFGRNRRNRFRINNHGSVFVGTENRNYAYDRSIVPLPKHPTRQ